MAVHLGRCRVLGGLPEAMRSRRFYPPLLSGRESGEAPFQRRRHPIGRWSTLRLGAPTAQGYRDKVGHRQANDMPMSRGGGLHRRARDRADDGLYRTVGEPLGEGQHGSGMGALVVLDAQFHRSAEDAAGLVDRFEHQRESFHLRATAFGEGARKPVDDADLDGVCGLDAGEDAQDDQEGGGEELQQDSLPGVGGSVCLPGTSGRPHPAPRTRRFAGPLRSGLAPLPPPWAPSPSAHRARNRTAMGPVGARGGW